MSGSFRMVSSPAYAHKGSAGILTLPAPKNLLDKASGACGILHAAYRKIKGQSCTQMNLEKTNYKAQVYELLEGMIVHGQLNPGQRLVESELATSMGVSRSPVREAIVALCQDGLIVNRKGKWFVSEVSLRDVLEFYEVRRLVEVTAGKQGCLNCPPEILDEMKLLVDQLDRTSEVQPFQEKNRRLHELIVLSHGNEKFREVFLWARRNIRWCGYFNLEIPGRREQTNKEHREIVQGFVRKDPDYVVKVIDNHISSVQNVVAANWEKFGFELRRCRNRANGSTFGHLHPDLSKAEGNSPAMKVNI